MNKTEFLDAYAESSRLGNNPPLANKIVALFMITERKYLSFKEIKDELDISKGALSKMLNLLIDLRRILYIRDKENPRKRFFALDIEGISEHLKIITDNYEMQKQLLKDSLAFRKNSNDDLTDFIINSIDFNEAMISELRKLTKKHFGK